jgi:hypothetical protein
MNIAKHPSESLAPWRGATAALREGAAEKVRAWWRRASRVYPESTQKGEGGEGARAGFFIDLSMTDKYRFQIQNTRPLRKNESNA